MKYYKLILFFIIFSCSEKDKSFTIEINPEKFENGSIFISDFGEYVEYLKLDTSPIFQSIITFDATDSLLFFCVRPNGKLIVYNKEGKFLNDVGQNGRGPGEYKHAMYFSLDKENKKVFVLTQQKIIVFSFDGVYKNAFAISDFEGNFDDIKYFNNKIYLFENIKMGYAKYNWLILDTLGKYIDSKRNSIPKFKSRQIPLDDITFKHNNNLYYWNQFNDSIFKIDVKMQTVNYLFSQGDFRITPDNRDNDIIYYNRCFRPRKIIKTNDFLFIKYAVQKKWGIAMLNKSRKIFISYELNNSIENIGIINDFDGGVSFDPQQYFVVNKKEYLISWIDAYQLKTHVKSNEFKNSTPPYTPKRKKNWNSWQTALKKTITRC